MAKRILATILSLAMLLTCISGLTLIASADDSDATLIRGPLESYNDVSALHFGDNWAFFDLGVEEGLYDMDLTFYYASNKTDWWQIQLSQADGTRYTEGGYSAGDGFGGTPAWLQETKGAWSTGTISFAQAKLGVQDEWKNGVEGTKFDFGFHFSGGNDTYICGIKFDLTDAAGAKTSKMWGVDPATLITSASVNYTSGEEKTENVTITEKRSNNNNGETNGLPVEEYAEGKYGLKMFSNQDGDKQWNGANMKIKFTGVPEGDLVLAIEYYMPAGVGSGNTRMQVKAGNQNRVELNFNNQVLKTGAEALYAKALTADEAAQLRAGEALEIGIYHGADQDNDYFYVLSAMVMPASKLQSVANPGYDFYDFVKTYAPNAMYPQYTANESYGMTYAANTDEGKGELTEDGLFMPNEKPMVYFGVTSALTDGEDAKTVAIRYTFKEDAGEFDMQYNSTTEDYKGTHVKIENGVAEVVLEDAKFTNKQNNASSFRANLNNLTLKRVEVYTVVDKTALNEAIASVADVDTTGKTEASIAAMNAAKEAAEAVANNDFALATDVEKALNALNAAKELKDILVIEGETTIYAKDAATLSGNRITVENDGNNIGMADKGDYAEFEVDVKATGDYAVKFYAANGTSADYKESLSNDKGTVYGEITVVGDDGNWGTYNPYDLGLVHLKAGVQKLRVNFVDGGSNFQKMELVKEELLVWESDGLQAEHNGVNSLEFRDRWALFDLGMEGVYDMDVTFYYASTGTPWWQLQLSDAEGNRYSEDGKYSENDGFQQNADWMTNSGDEWTSGTVSFTGVKLGADDEWKPSIFGGGDYTSFDFGFHIAGENNTVKAKDEDGNVLKDEDGNEIDAVDENGNKIYNDPNLYIAGIKFEIKDAEGNVTTKMWGEDPTAVEDPEDPEEPEEPEDPEEPEVELVVGTTETYEDVDALHFNDNWALFDLKMPEGVYDMDVTFYYASTEAGWWQLQLSRADGTRYTGDDDDDATNDIYNAGDGFFGTPTWLTDFSGEWASGSETFTGAKLGADDEWKAGVNSTVHFDFGFHFGGGNTYICGVKFDIKDAEGNVTTKMWGVKPEIEEPEEPGEPGEPGEPEEGGFDLIVEDFEITTNKAGDAAQIYAIIKNVGTKPVPAGSRYGVRFDVVDADGNKTVLWTDKLKREPTEALEPGATLKTPLSNGDTVNGDDEEDPKCGTFIVPEGEFTILAEVNDNESDGIVGELDRTNNTKTKTYTGLNVNTKPLEAAVAAAEAVDATKYTEETAKALADALAAGKALDLTKADQAAVDAATKAITDAIDALKEKGEAPKIIWGDADKSGEVTTSDVRVILQFMAELIGADQIDLVAADVDGVEGVTTNDARVILQYMAELVSELPLQPAE